MFKRKATASPTRLSPPLAQLLLDEKIRIAKITTVDKGFIPTLQQLLTKDDEMNADDDLNYYAMLVGWN